jgi:LPS-assembly protein
MIGTPTRRRPHLPGRAVLGASAILVALLAASGALFDAAMAQSQTRLAFPARPAPPPPPPAPQGDAQMLVRADRIDYDYSNQRVSAVGSVQIYYRGSTIEADKVIYDQKTKRLHGEGNVRLIEPGGRITYGEILNFTDDLRDGFVDSLRVETPDQTRMAAARATRTGGNFTVFESGVYTACEPCKDDPRKPPLWQVKAARVVHDQGEKMIYFEGARLEFYGHSLIYLPYFSTPDPTVKRKTGFLTPILSSSLKYGAAAEVPYFWALAPDYDVTLSPMLTTRQGLLMKGEWRQRLMTGAYSIRAAGIFQLDKD